MGFRMESTYSEIEKILDVKYIATLSIGYTLPPGMYEIIDNNLMLKSLPPDDVKVNITHDDIRLRSNLATNKTIRCTKKSFVFLVIGFVESCSWVLDDNPGSVQLIPGFYKNEKPSNNT